MLLFLVSKGYSQSDSLKINQKITFDDLLGYSLQELSNIKVAGVSKKDENIEEAPGIVSIITAHEIKSYGANNLIDILQQAPSLQMLSSHIYREGITGLRGDLITQNDNHILILLDGRPVRNGLNDANNIFFANFPIGSIDRIEVIRGPSSVLYGTNAFAGIINIITKSQGNNTTVQGGYGSFGTYMGSIYSEHQKDDFYVGLGAMGIFSDGWDFNATTGNEPGFPDSTSSMPYARDNLGITAQLKYKGFKFNGFYGSTNERTLGTLPVWSTAEDFKQHRYFADLGYKLDLPKKWELNTNLTFNAATSTRDPDASQTLSLTGYYDYLLESTLFGEITKNLNLTFGAYVKNVIIPNIDLSDNEATIFIEGTNTNFAAYTQLDYLLFEKLKLIVGIQMNIPKETKTHFVPRLGAIYSINKKFVIKALYASAYRSASPVETDIDISGVIIGNPAVGPEVITTTDIQFSYKSKYLNAAITGFNSDYKDLIGRVPTADPNDGFTSTFLNGHSLNIKGAEAEFKAQIIKQLFINGSYTYQYNVEELLPGSNSMFKLGATYRLPTGLNFGVFNSFFGKSKDNGATKLNPDPSSINLLSANITYNLTKFKFPMEFTLYGKNLLDSQSHYTEFVRNWYNTLPIYPGRSIYFKVAVKF